MIRLLYPLIVLAYIVGGILAGPFIGWRTVLGFGVYAIWDGRRHG